MKPIPFTLAYTPNDEIKRQEKIEKLFEKSTELQNKLEKAQIKLDKIR